ncbi:glycosyltransferase family 9 protein [Fulvivirgaceae bacterium LMO-SS25]
MKILILRFSSIGDIVLTTPVIRTLKTQLDNAEIHFATKKNYLSILEANPYLSKIHLLENSTSDLIKELKKEKFDFIVDLHNNLRTRQIKLALGVKSKSFKKLNVEKWLKVQLKIDRLPNVHIVDRYMDTVKDLGVKMDALGLDYFIPHKDEVENDWLPEAFQKEYVVYAIGGQHATKRLPLGRMIELCDKINKPIILIGGKEDKKTAQSIVDFFERREENQDYEPKLTEMNKKTIIFDTCGKLSFNQSASIIKNANYVFSHDTGMMHIAAAFQKQLFTIWGNTIPSFGMYPYRTKFVILEKQGLGCRPCSKIGFDKCPKGHFDCMNKIVFDFWLP